MRAIVIIAPICLLTACASTAATEGQKLVVGKSKDQIEACMGIPDKTEGDFSEWQHKDGGNQASLPLSSIASLPITLPIALPMALAGSVSLNDAGDCTAVAHYVAGSAKTFIFTGKTSGLDGEYSKCLPLMKGCLANPPK